MRTFPISQIIIIAKTLAEGLWGLIRRGAASYISGVGRPRRPPGVGFCTRYLSSIYHLSASPVRGEKNRSELIEEVLLCWL
jgi:hypothetical protein